jgi:hypothetical protein
MYYHEVVNESREHQLSAKAVSGCMRRAEGRHEKAEKPIDKNKDVCNSLKWSRLHLSKEALEVELRK